MTSFRVRRLVDVLNELLDVDFVISVVPLSDHKGLAKTNSRMSECQSSHFLIFPLLYSRFELVFLAFCTNQFQIAPNAQFGHCPFSIICSPKQLRSEQLKSTYHFTKHKNFGNTSSDPLRAWFYRPVLLSLMEKGTNSRHVSYTIHNPSCFSCT